MQSAATTFAAPRELTVVYSTSPQYDLSRQAAEAVEAYLRRDNEYCNQRQSRVQQLPTSTGFFGKLLAAAF